MKVSVIGTGYVGLVSGVCLAELGHQVTCIDIDSQKVDSINNGIPPIYEKGLKELLRKHVNKRFRATSDYDQAINESVISIIAVGTPYKGDQIDLSFIETASRQIAEVIKYKNDFHMIVVKSTVVPGTTDKVVKSILETHSGKSAGIDFGVGMNPEFLREGSAVYDFLNPDRIVLGASDDRGLEMMEGLYQSFLNTDKLKTNTHTAEMIKYASNALLATLISFSNEIANLCTAIGDIDVKDVMRGVHLDKRLSPIQENGTRIIPKITTYLEAGCGFGGSCFPKDVKALIAHGRKYGNPMQILEAIVDVNEQQPFQLIEILEKHFATMDKLTVGILGLSFKPGTDDVRESPAIPIILNLVSRGVAVKAYDPAAVESAKKLLGGQNITYCDTLEAAVSNVDAVLLVTCWEEFSRLPELLAVSETQPLLIDGRRMLDSTTITLYEGIGLRRAG